MERIKLDQATHTYSIRDKKLMSVSDFLVRLGIKKTLPDFTVINNAAILGTQIHEEIEEYIYYLTPFDEAVERDIDKFIRREKIDRQSINCEMIVNNEWLAGTIDFVNYRQDGKIILVDWKTGSVDGADYQLNMYRFLISNGLTEDDVQMYIGRVTTGVGVEFIEVEYIDIHPLIVAYNEGHTIQEYNAKMLNLSNDSILTLQQEIEKYKDLEERIKKGKAIILNAMQENNIKCADFGDVTFTAKKPFKKVTINVKGLKESHPAIYEQYSKETQIGSSLLINFKNK